MEKFVLNIEPVPRLLSFPLKVRSLGYVPVNYHNRKCAYETVDFSFELSGTTPNSIITAAGKEHINKFPCALVNVPDVYYETLTPTAWEVLYFAYDKTLFPLIHEWNLDKLHPKWEFQITTNINRIIKDIFELSGRIHEHGVCDKIDALCYSLIVETITYNQNTVHMIDNNEQIVREIASYVEFNYDKDISILKLLKKHGISKRTFFRYWKKIFRSSPTKYINELKINSARGMLKDSLLRITEIAENLGFKDPLYFSRAFKNHVGISPLQYRKRSKVSNEQLSVGSETH